MITVIGGAGFIGTRLGQLLENERTPWQILDKRTTNTFAHKTTQVNILDAEKLKASLSGSTVLVNLAAEHKDNVQPRSLYYDVNVQGAQNVCDACEANGVNTIIFTSSVAVYGLNKPNPDESFVPDPWNDYAKSKAQAEKVYENWYQKATEERTLIIIRPTVVFGEENRGNVYNLLRQIASKKFLKIGNGKNQKSMAYVGNVAAFIHHNINRQGAGNDVFNYVDTPDLNMEELVAICQSALDIKLPNLRIPYGLGLLIGYGFDLLSAITRKELPVSSVRIKKFCATTKFNATKAHQSGFKAPYSMEEALQQTLSHEFGK